MSRRLWTPDQDAVLLAMLATGKTQQAIAAALGRPISSIPSRLEKLQERKRAPQLLGEPSPTMPHGQRSCVKEGGLGDRKQRKCLNCQRPFESAHCMNRLCAVCRRNTTSPFDL